jgi:NADH dehydrogenase FAD-containing subunit
VVVVGGGYGGSTVAKYLRLLSKNQIKVTLIEPDSHFVSCPLSNLVITGTKNIADITLSYDALNKIHGIQIVRDRVVLIDPIKRKLTTSSNVRYYFYGGTR